MCNNAYANMRTYLELFGLLIFFIIKVYFILIDIFVIKGDKWQTYLNVNINDIDGIAFGYN